MVLSILNYVISFFTYELNYCQGIQHTILSLELTPTGGQRQDIVFTIWYFHVSFNNFIILNIVRNYSNRPQSKCSFFLFFFESSVFESNGIDLSIQSTAISGIRLSFCCLMLFVFYCQLFTLVQFQHCWQECISLTNFFFLTE